MNWIPLLLLPLIALIFLIPPLFQKRVEKWDVPEARIEALEEKKRMLVVAIREFDFDFDTGKLSLEDYEEQRARFKTELADVIRQLKEEETRVG